MTVLTYATSGNIPSDVSSFVGRDGTLTSVRALMSTARCTTLVGPGGIGKTRLALRLADQLRSAYPDGVWVVELAGVSDGDLVVRTISETLGLRDESTDPPAEVLADYLRDRHLLIVLDNCEHLLTSCAVVVHELLSRSPHLRIVTTSRRRLGVPGEHVVQVPPLTTPPPKDRRYRRRRPAATRRWHCSPTARPRPTPRSSSPSTTSRRSRAWSRGSPGYLWRSSSPRRGSGRCRCGRSWIGSRNC